MAEMRESENCVACDFLPRTGFRRAAISGQEVRGDASQTHHPGVRRPCLAGDVL